MQRLPAKRPPTHPGVVLQLDFLEPLSMTQVELAERMGVPFQRVNQIVRQRRAVTPDTALRLAHLFGTTAMFWLNLQQVGPVRYDFIPGRARDRSYQAAEEGGVAALHCRSGLTKTK
jgi:antitoxin HigA-1